MSLLLGVRWGDKKGWTVGHSDPYTIRKEGRNGEHSQEKKHGTHQSLSVIYLHKTKTFDAGKFN